MCVDYWLGLDARDGDTITVKGKTMAPEQRALPAAIRFLQSHPNIGLQIQCLDDRINLLARQDKNSFDELYGERIRIIHTPAFVTSDGQMQYISGTPAKREDTALDQLLKDVETGKIKGMFTFGCTSRLVEFACRNIGRYKGLRVCPMFAVYPVLTASDIKIHGRRAYHCTDVGGSVDASPEKLRDFALLGHSYLKGARGISNPSIGFISNGTEDKKGTQEVRDAIKLLREYDGINCVGQVEPIRVLRGYFDLVISNGFVGNILLKQAEGLRECAIEMTRDAVNSLIPIDKLMGYRGFKGVKKYISRMTENKGNAAPLLGFPHTIVKGHGTADQIDIEGGLRLTKKCFEEEVPRRTGDELQRVFAAFKEKSTKS